MRIISGEFRGRKLTVPKGKRIRPTTDRVKESVFNIIGPRVQGAQVLDLFAGTGNLGLEALSRGADHAVFVEINAKHAGLIESSTRLFGCENRSKVICADARNTLKIFEANRFDLVFLDPPYEMKPVLQAVIDSDAFRDCLNENALVVVETGNPNEIIVKKWFQTLKLKEYGDTIIAFLEPTLNETQTDGSRK